MKAIIFCSGSIDDYRLFDKIEFNKHLVLCADGGVVHTEKLGIKPNVIIGDNDSWKEEYKAEKVFVYPKRKDFTDTNLCIDYAIEKGCDQIDIYGGFGGRHDHEFSHYCLMAYALDKGVVVTMINETNRVWMENKPFTINSMGYKYISFFPFGENISNFSVKGLRYEAENINLLCNRALTISNQFENEKSAEVSFDNGKLLVMLCNDKRE